MTRQYLVHSVHKDAVQAAARSFGAQVLARPFSSGDLERLKAPILIVFDDDGTTGLTPDILQSLRRAHRGGVRYSPVVVFVARRGDMSEWRNAGAVAAPPGADKHAVKAAIQQAVEGQRGWVTSASYVGPDRRRHRPLIAWQGRRQADKAKPATQQRRPERAGNARVSSLEQVHRRLFLSATLLSGATIEARRAFRDLTDEAQVSAQAHNRGDLSGIIAAIRREAEAFVQNGQRDVGALERLVADLGEALDRRRP